jgi:hypothetical protein
LFKRTLSQNDYKYKLIFPEMQGKIQFIFCFSRTNLPGFRKQKNLPGS